MDPLTLFSWGYWGWGSATDQLIRAVDAVEASRGFNPPMFVDIRISRSVRAPGFDGHAFEDAVGPSRYRWLDALGNVAVKEGGAMRIKDPAAADTLLDIAEASARDKQRVLFFCSCEYPGTEDNHGCHRSTVARLVLEAATRRRRLAKVVEWPGGEPILEGLEYEMSASEFAKLQRGALSIPLDEPVDLAEIASVPWCSLILVEEASDECQSELEIGKGQLANEDAEVGVVRPYYQLITGPARYRKGRWYLPVYGGIDPDLNDDEAHKQVMQLRERSGFLERKNVL